MRSSASRKMTDSQSKYPRATSLHARHGRLAGRLAMALSTVFSRDPHVLGARGRDGECPWGDPVAPPDARRTFEHAGVVPGTPDEVFPLLCPVLEYEWLDDWTCAMQYSESGVAERGCAFSTQMALGERWICSRYEPGESIQYVIWLSVGWMILEADLGDLGDGTTELSWRRTLTATSALGRKRFAELDTARVEAEMAALNGRLVTFLEGRG